jgi:hypothetical protein
MARRSAEAGMKIEIGEFLILSWLRHVRGCVLTQMNWIPSPAWPIARERELITTFETVRRLSDAAIGAPIFDGCELRPFLRQARIDVLGLRPDREAGAIEAIAVDSAFHEGELHDDNAEETIGRVVKRMIRAAFALDAYLPLGQASVVFATPWMSGTIRQDVQRHLGRLEARLAEQRGPAAPRLRFRVIANADFTDEIVQPVLAHVDAIADTSGLLRQAQQLARPRDSGSSDGGARAGTDRPGATRKASRIGEHVRSTMTALAASGRLTARIVGNLLDTRYCKAKFDLGHPFLKPVDGAIPLARQGKDRHGRGRYWKQPLKIAGGEFLMCSQWFVWQRDAFDGWVRDLG